ncbi:MAG: Clp protease ClpP [Armatimonadetes bacterium]|nr:Clp protease ClpP [Armatimonadota bacterium]
MNKADKAEVWIYEQIGEDFFGEGLTAKSFTNELAALDTAQIDLHINSPGGSVFDGQAIYNALLRHPANVTTYIDGVAASIAGVVALAGDEVVMASNALFMVHNAWGMAMGTSDDIRAYADVLDKVGGTIVGVYQRKTDMDEGAIKSLMDAETWMTADEAVEYGFADKVGSELKAAACAFDFSPFGYKHPPAAIVAAVEEPEAEAAPEPEPEAEAAEVSDNLYLGLALGLSPPDKE